jgi:AcrR family transcriptional regulator
MSVKQVFDPASETKWRVISAATHLFSEKGMDNVSLRELTAAAGVNLAAVNYHFGTKEALCEAVLDSLALSVNKRRLGKLRKVLTNAEAANRAPDLEDILETFMAPYLGPDHDPEGALLAQLSL